MRLHIGCACYFAAQAARNARARAHAPSLPGVPFTGDGFDVSPTVVNPESHNQLMDVLMSRTRTDLQQVVKESLDGVRCKVSVDAVIDASPLRASRTTSRTKASTSWSWAARRGGCPGAPGVRPAPVSAP